MSSSWTVLSLITLQWNGGRLNPIRSADALYVSAADKPFLSLADITSVIGRTEERPDSIQEWGVHGNNLSPNMDKPEETVLGHVSSVHVCDDLARGVWGRLEHLRGQHHYHWEHPEQLHHRKSTDAYRGWRKKREDRLGANALWAEHLPPQESPNLPPNMLHIHFYFPHHIISGFI